MAYKQDCQTVAPKYVQTFIDKTGTKRHYLRKRGRKRVALPDPSSKEFLDAYEAALQTVQPEMTKRHKEAAKLNLEIGAMNLIRDYLVKGVGRASSRSREKNLDFDLTFEWADAKVREQDYRCAVTGIRFFAKRKARSKCEPFAPSFDRIDPRRGYTQDNVRVVLFSVNVMMQDWGLSVLETVARNLVAREATR